MCTLLEQLKDWQPAIGTIVGFGGLISAALINASLNRKRDRNLRNEEGAATAAALYGEVLLLRRELSDVAKQVANFGIQKQEIDEDFVETRLFSEPRIYQAFTPKLGLLQPAVILGITKFYRHFEEARRSLPLLVYNTKRGFSYNFGAFLEPAQSAVEDILPTMRLIETQLRIPAHNEDCDLGHTATIIEHEQQEYS